MITRYTSPLLIISKVSRINFKNSTLPTHMNKGIIIIPSLFYTQQGLNRLDIAFKTWVFQGIILIFLFLYSNKNFSFL